MNKKQEIIKQLQKIEKFTKVFSNDVVNNKSTNDIEALQQLWKVYDNLYNTLVNNLKVE